MKMKFQHGKRQKIKDSTDEISSKYVFTEYSIMIWKISTHKVAKIQLLGTKIHYTKFQRIKGVENEVLAQKTTENQRFYG